MIFSGQCKEKITIIRAKQRSSNHRLTPHSLFFVFFLSFFLSSSCIWRRSIFNILKTDTFWARWIYFVVSIIYWKSDVDLTGSLTGECDLFLHEYSQEGIRFIVSPSTSICTINNFIIIIITIIIIIAIVVNARSRRLCPNTTSGLVCDSTDITLFATTPISRCLPLHQ